MLRRHLIALGGAAMVGTAVPALGELLAELPGPDPVLPPAQLGPAYLAQVQDLTRRLAEADRGSLTTPEVLSAAAAWAMRLLDVPGPDHVQQALKAAVAELHIEAGWSAFDATFYPRALYHYSHALELATDAKDAYLQALALGYAGLATVEHGHPNDGLKMLQCAQVQSWTIPSDEQRTVVVGEHGKPAVQATVLADTAAAHTAFGQPQAAYRDLGTARQLWTPTRRDRYGDLDRPTALLELDRGHLDVAEQLATNSVRRWDGISHRARTHSTIVLATIHVRAGEANGLRLAHDAITAVGKLSSTRTRRYLQPLTDALSTRRESEARDLAHTARTVALSIP